MDLRQPEGSISQPAPKRSRAHHYVPQTYLREWAESGRIAVRRRGADRAFVASTARVAQETDLYTVDTDSGPSDRVEKDLASLEGHIPDALRAIRQFKVPRRGTERRELCARLLALQFVRTPDRMEMRTFPNDALQAASGVRPIPKEVIKSLLEEHGGYQPSESEIQGVWDYANYIVNQEQQLSRAQYLDTMFGTVPALARRLMNMSWCVEQTKGQRFITSDQPLTLWVRRPTAMLGVGIDSAEEIRFPTSPHHLLVLRHKGPETAKVVPKARVAAVNKHAASTCRHMVMGRTSDLSQLESLPLRDKRPMWKINEGPLFRPDVRGGGDQYEGQVMHFYRPYDDRDITEYPPPTKRARPAAARSH